MYYRFALGWPESGFFVDLRHTRGILFSTGLVVIGWTLSMLTPLQNILICALVEYQLLMRHMSLKSVHHQHTHVGVAGGT